MTATYASLNDPGRVLVVDDDDINRQLLHDVLAAKGHHVEEVGEGSEQLLRNIAAHPPDVILLDLMLPGIDGLTLCKRLKGDPATMPIPVLMLTSYNDRAIRLTGIANGANDFLLKPIDTMDVQLRVRNAIAMKRMYDQMNQGYTKLKELEALRDTLTGMIVHDLRSPLTSIRGYQEMFLRQTGSGVPDNLRAYIERAFAQTNRLVDMVSQLLDASRLEGGELPLTKGTFDLRVLVAKAIEQIQAHAQARGMSFRNEVAGQVDCDGALIGRVLANLLGNAVKYTADNDTIEIASEVGSGLMRVTITDHGPGIDQEFQHRLFEKFGALAVRNVYKPYSTGLSLYFCKLVIAAHGGRIGVDSVKDKGAKFWFTLPVA